MFRIYGKELVLIGELSPKLPTVTICLFNLFPNDCFIYDIVKKVYIFETQALHLIMYFTLFLKGHKVQIYEILTTAFFSR